LAGIERINSQGAVVVTAVVFAVAVAVDFVVAVKAFAFRLLVLSLDFNGFAVPSSALRAPSPEGRREQ